MKKISKSVLVDKHLKAALAPYGFKRKLKLEFQRSAGNCIQVIGIHTSFGGMELSPVISVEFPQLKSILNPGEKQSLSWVLFTPLHFLCRDGKYFTWHVETEEDIIHAVESMMLEITTAGFQYFQRNATLQAVEDALTRSIIPNEYAVNLAGATGILAACRLLRGDYLSAIQAIEDGLAHRFNKTTHMRRRIEEARQRIMIAAEEMNQMP